MQEAQQPNEPKSAEFSTICIKSSALCEIINHPTSKQITHTQKREQVKKKTAGCYCTSLQQPVCLFSV